MEEPKRLLVIDDDFHAYDLPSALNQAMDELRRDGKRWTFYVHSQEKCPDVLERGHYHALLIDNDFGEGMVTLAGLVNGHGIGIPIAYITSQDIDGLLVQNSDLTRRARPTISPYEFKKYGVSHIRKKGKKFANEVTLEDLRIDLAEFLKRSSS